MVVKVLVKVHVINTTVQQQFQQSHVVEVHGCSEDMRVGHRG